MKKEVQILSGDAVKRYKELMRNNKCSHNNNNSTDNKTKKNDPLVLCYYELLLNVLMPPYNITHPPLGVKYDIQMNIENKERHFFYHHGS